MDSQSLGQIVDALERVHRPSSSPDERHAAQELLDSLKQRDDAALIGWTLASPDQQGSIGIIRHFGLSLLQHVIQFHYIEYPDDKRIAIRDWVVNLAFAVTSTDPHYILEKIASLWVAIAKRVWGLDTHVDHANDDVVISDAWVDMDKQLLVLWNQSSATRELSLSVLRTLFEDLYMLDDPVASRRSAILSTQCTEIITPAPDLGEVYDARVPQLQMLRAGDEGWLQLWSNALRELSDDNSRESERLLRRLLETLKSCLFWAIPRSIVRVNMLQHLLPCVKSMSVQVRNLSSDCVYILFTRGYSRAQDFDSIVGQMFLPEGINWLTSVYDSINIDPDNIDDEENVFLKKFIELVMSLGEYLDSPKFPLPPQTDFAGYFALILKIAQHPSLMASSFSIQFWGSLLRLESLVSRKDVEDILPALLHAAAERCIDYSNMPADHVSHKFMDADFDSEPEAQSFYGNYRKYMEDIVRLIVCRIPLPSLHWLHQGMSNLFESQLGWQAMNQPNLDHKDPAYILASGQIMVVEAALRGVSRWLLWASESDREALNDQILELVSEWCEEMINLQVVDTDLHRKIVESLVQFAPLLKERYKVVFRILERVLAAATFDYPPDLPGNDEDRERVRDLRAASGTELNRLAYMIPEALVQIYGDLERVIAELLASGKVQEHESVSFKSFLLVVSQRSSLPNKAEKFSAIVDPVFSSWTEESTMKGLMDLEWFMERVGIVRIAEYFRSRGITGDTNLLETPMDEQGRELKAELKQKWQAIFPIRPSRIFIQYTIERLEHKSPEYLHLLGMWKPRVQPILPHILQLITQIIAYHNPENWVSLPPEVRTFVKISCTERFWQAGVSMQTRDEFENQSLEASKTLRDFADSVGHIIRYTREYAFLTLGSITQLNETMFEIDGMGGMLYQALAGSNTVGITSHCWRHMISLVVRNAVRNCPEPLLYRFLGDFLPPFLLKINEVLVQKWQTQSEFGFQLMDDDRIEKEEDLSEEMMDEHLLRQLTAIVVRLLMDLVKPEPGEHKIAVREACMANPEILLSIFKLISSIMLFKDSRCCYNTCLNLSYLLAPGTNILKHPSVADFVSGEILPTCLQILSDPFFYESHVEAGNVLALIYERMQPQASLMLMRLKDLIGDVSVESLEELDRSLSAAHNLRLRRGIVLDFLSMCRIVPTDDETRARSRKRLEKKVSRRNDPSDSYDATAIINMFGDA